MNLQVMRVEYKWIKWRGVWLGEDNVLVVVVVA